MFQRKQKAQDAAVARYMDELEADGWARKQVAERDGQEAADKLDPHLKIDDVVEVLLGMCGDEVGRVLDALESWYQAREAELVQPEDEDRSDHVAAAYLEIFGVGIGNLFGFIPENGLNYDADLAARGRKRDWRT